MKNQKNIEKQISSTKDLVKTLYKDESNRPFALTDTQEEIFNCIFKKQAPDKKKRIHIETHTQYGKQISHNIPILVNDGWKKHGDLKVGDYVFGLDGKPKKVLALSEESYATYEISFSNGEKIKCHENHEWVVRHRDWKRKGQGFKVLETKELLKYSAYNFHIPEINHIDFGKEKKLSIDPYTLGVWLGDGHTDFSKGLTNLNLTNLNLRNNKHIPDVYKRSSYESRLKLIAGLIDINKQKRENNGRIYIININKKLIDDIEEVLRSLGIRNISVNCKSSSGINGKKDVYYLGFSPTINFPTVLKRKKIKVTITDIKKIKPEKGRCIQVEGGVYLAGKKLIPTHNSDVVSMAVLTRAATFPEKWIIVAPSQPKARIIMSKIIKHIFENEYTLGRFKIKDGENVDSIRRERSKNRLTFDTGNNGIGEVFILTAESRITQGDDAGNAMMGFGAPNVVMDEAALISDDSDAKAMRMVGGFAAQGEDFVCKIGNPFLKGRHFKQSFEDPSYYNIVVDYKKSLEEKNEYGEGRLSESYIDEMKKKPFFRVLYECKFPLESDIDEKGWTQLVSEDDVEKAMLKDDEEIEHVGEKRIGNDVARGGDNLTVWIARSMNFAEIIQKSSQDNLTEIASYTAIFMKEHGVKAENVFIDDIGVGGGAVDPLKSQQKNVKGVNVQMKALDESKFINVRAESYWRLREWIKKGGRLSNDKDWFQLCNIKYKPDTKGRLRVISKDEMRMQGIDSPDIADALMLTFARKEHGDIEFRRKMKNMKRKKQKLNKGVKLTMGGY